ncbi:MAG: hypothetical protein L0229_02860 [Blastocatellia bacterium]|nr:hypothetical protein [Blastocatellia bacterium]
MISKEYSKQPGRSSTHSHRQRAAALVAIMVMAIAALACQNDGSGPQSASPATSDSANPATPAGQPGQNASAGTEIHTMEVAKAVMVTVELDFGSKPPTIAEALREVERRYVPDDGRGRTFAVLDAYGETTPDGKLHMSMHVSSEKPGLASLVFRRTGEVLWQSRVLPTNNPPPAAKNLGIIIDNGAGTSYSVDGSNNPATIFDATVKGLNVTVGQFWPDGAEREVTFIYSACGCPVKVTARRAGKKTVRTKDLPVIFPDDPAAVAVINKLMGW